MSAPRFDLPSVDSESEPFWSAARDHRLVINRCATCGEPFFYPRAICPRCWSDEIEWFEASGRATVYTYSVVYQNDLPPFADQVPYIAAVVELEEGPRMMTRVVDCAPDEITVGLPVTVAFEELDDEIVAPVFRPVR